MTRICSVCNIPKPIKEFHRDEKSVGGVRKECKSCRRAKDPRRGAHRTGSYKQPPRVPPPELISATSAPDPVGDKVRCLVLLPDVHIPDHDRLVWSAVLQWIREHQPDEIILTGDFLELESCSMHAGGFNEQKVNDDFAAGRYAIEQLQDAAPDANMVMLEGNHETRLNRLLMAKAPALIGALTVEKELRLADLGIPYVPQDKQPITRGNLDILHGHQMARGKSDILPKHHAMKAISIYGVPGRMITYGHTHKPQAHTEPGHGGNKTAVGLGCMRTLDPAWLQGAKAGWEHQFGVVYIRPSGRVDMFPVTITNGTFTWAGKVYVGKR